MEFLLFQKTCTMHKIEKGSFSNFKYRENFSFWGIVFVEPRKFSNNFKQMLINLSNKKAPDKLDGGS